MKLLRWADIPVEPMNKSVTRQALHCSTLTIARLVLAKGAVVPFHSHTNEQVSTVESGRLRFIVGAEEIIVEKGESLQIPSGIPHTVEALEDSVALDVFSPAREDWIRGDDAYLRGG
jgi:quercetin dioxygenase-like cupin family protein